MDYNICFGCHERTNIENGILNQISAPAYYDNHVIYACNNPQCHARSRFIANPLTKSITLIMFTLKEYNIIYHVSINFYADSFVIKRIEEINLFQLKLPISNSIVSELNKDIVSIDNLLSIIKTYIVFS